MIKTFTAALAALALAASPVCPQQESQQDRKALEASFEALLDGAQLVGHFTAVGDGGESTPVPDSYSVSKISRMDDGRWLFTASMSFGDDDVAIPMPFDVEWAGDTPIITLTDQTIEGLGTFTARVLIHDGLYAGTWKHGAFGGHMWGRIETPTDAEAR